MDRPLEARPVLVDQVLDVCVARGVADLHVNPGAPPTARIEDRLVPLGSGVWGADATERFCRGLCSERHWHEVQDRGTTDFGIQHREGDRFRVSVMRQRAGYGAVLRRIPSDFLTFEEIGLPKTVPDLLKRHQGLILVTGATGSGKSTTLATMVNWINENYERHVITIEDPVEFHHSHKKSLITQREVGSDVESFAEAMRRALRQDPDVILVGEMRDLETIASALTAAETGHLVFGTLHTMGASQSVSRIIDVFPAAQQEQIRVQLAMSLLGVISQVLIPTTPGFLRPDGTKLPGRVAGLEVLVSTPAVANMIRNNDINRIVDVIQTSRDQGMFTLDDYLLDLVGRGWIEREMARGYTADTLMFDRRLNGG
ncbi:PilT/PilU family type 4a pilus ATPase [bacterium]|nr:PilT/PilU family type 4a pilus ATPase [bacterium]